MRLHTKTCGRTACELPPRVLVAEDDWYMANGIEHSFKREGYDVRRTDNGRDAADLLEGGIPFDVVLLDVVMPYVDGFEVLTRVRKAGVRTPVIMVSGRVSESDRVRGLRLGADDYVAKPFSHRELVARAEAVRKRGDRARCQPQCIRVGNVTARFDKRRAEKDGEPVHFTPLEWSVLQYMAHREGKAVSREEFNVKVLKIPADIPTRTIDRHAYSLRCKIDHNPKKPHHILSVKGIGYRLADFELME